MLGRQEYLRGCTRRQHQHQRTARQRPLHVELEPDDPEPEEPELDDDEVPLPLLLAAGAAVEVEAALLPEESDELVLGVLAPGAAGDDALLPSFLVDEYRSEYQPPPFN